MYNFISLDFSVFLQFDLQYGVASHANHQEDDGEDQLREDTDSQSLGDEGEEKSWKSY